MMALTHDDANFTTWTWVFEALRLISISLVLFTSPAVFPSEYDKTVYLFERPEEHALIVSREYRAVNQRATVLLPFALCVGVSLPLCNVGFGTLPYQVLQTAIVLILFTGILFLVFPIASLFGTDSSPMSLHVRPSAFVYLAAFVPATANALAAISTASKLRR